MFCFSILLFYHKFHKDFHKEHKACTLVSFVKIFVEFVVREKFKQLSVEILRV